MHPRHWLVTGVLLAALASLLVVYILSTTPRTRTVLVGISPQAVAVDERTSHVFVSNHDSSTLSMLATQDRVVLKTIPIVGHPGQVIVDGRTGHAFVGSDTNVVSVVDTASGAVRRTVSVGPLLLHTMVLDERRGEVFVLTGMVGTPSVVVVLDARSGAVVHRFPVGGAEGGVMALDRPRAQLVVVSGGVFQAGSVALLDALSGRVLRRVSVGGTPLAVAIDESSGRAFVTNALSSTVSVLDVRRGTIIRTVAVCQAPANVAVNPRTHRAFVVSQSQGTSVLDTRTGAVLHTVTTGIANPASLEIGPTDVVVDREHGHVFVLDGPGAGPDGQVSALDATTGRLVRRLPVGQLAVAMAVDEQSGQLVVVNMLGNAPSRANGTSLWQWVPAWAQRWMPWARPTAPASHTGTVTFLNVAHL